MSAVVDQSKRADNPEKVMFATQARRHQKDYFLGL
jgi:hypothetical protein